MKLATYKAIHSDTDQLGLVHPNEQSIEPITTCGLNYSTMNELIKHITPQEKQALQAKNKQQADFSLNINSIKLEAPIPEPRQDIICLGVNYTEHAKESARYKQEAFDLKAEYPVYFSKRVNRAAASGDLIPDYADLVDSLDYEVELAVILGRDARQVPLEQCADYIFGYTILNDISARNLQTRHKQWYYGKSLDSFTAMGPWIVTRDEFCFPPHLTIQSIVNGELRQDSRTEQMIFDIAYVLHDLSQGMTLKAGTIISMGTPKGVGMGFVPPRFLAAGDEVVCQIEGLGRLCNTIASSAQLRKDAEHDPVG